MWNIRNKKKTTTPYQRTNGAPTRRVIAHNKILQWNISFLCNFSEQSRGYSRSCISLVRVLFNNDTLVHGRSVVGLVFLRVARTIIFKMSFELFSCIQREITRFQFDQHLHFSLLWMHGMRHISRNQKRLGQSLLKSRLYDNSVCVIKII